MLSLSLSKIDKPKKPSFDLKKKVSYKNIKNKEQGQNQFWYLKFGTFAKSIFMFQI